MVNCSFHFESIPYIIKEQVNYLLRVWGEENGIGVDQLWGWIATG